MRNNKLNELASAWADRCLELVKSADVNEMLIISEGMVRVKTCLDEAQGLSLGLSFDNSKPAPDETKVHTDAKSTKPPAKPRVIEPKVEDGPVPEDKDSRAAELRSRLDKLKEAPF